MRGWLGCLIALTTAIFFNVDRCHAESDLQFITPINVELPTGAPPPNFDPPPTAPNPPVLRPPIELPQPWDDSPLDEIAFGPFLSTPMPPPLGFAGPSGV